MGNYVLPNIVSGGQLTVPANSLAEAQAKAAQQTGVSLTAQKAGGTFGSNTNPNLSSGGGGGGGAGDAASALGAIQQNIVNALASGNKAAFDEAVREFNQTFGLDQNKFNESVRQFNSTFAEQQRQYNQNFGLQQAGITGTYQQPVHAVDPNEFYKQDQATQDLYNKYHGANAAADWARDATGAVQRATPPQSTEAARQFNVTAGLNAAQLAGSLHADPFRQREVEGQLGRLLQGQGVAGFQSPTGSAADTSSVDYILNQIRNPMAAAAPGAVYGNIPAPNQVNAAEFFRSSPGTQQMLLSGIKAKYGLDPEDALSQIKATLPAFASPAMTGTVRA